MYVKKLNDLKYNFRVI